ncbi:hypothetical protein KI387_018028, partial [Taxus chinensis]
SNQLLGFDTVLGDFEVVAKPEEEGSVGKFLLSLWKEITRKTKLSSSSGKEITG